MTFANGHWDPQSVGGWEWPTLPGRWAQKPVIGEITHPTGKAIYFRPFIG